MCTVTIVPHREGFRLVCNRDELRTRPPAQDPAWRQMGSRAAISPVDPASGGTWIGANDAGVVMVVLNRTPRMRVPHPADLRSRGTIIPWLLRFSSEGQIIQAARNLQQSFAPFLLIAIKGRRLVTIRNERRLVLRRRRLVDPLLFTTSSLGDHLVQAPRRALFERLVRTTRTPLAGQTTFHRHSWANRPEISVWMARVDAATVSRTVIDVSSSRVSVEYENIAGQCQRI